MTAFCFDLCFQKKKYILDFECVSTCYNKYLFASKEIYESVIQEGRRCKSEYIQHSVTLTEKDRFKDHVFPIGGHPAMPGPLNLRRKFYENYVFSDPMKSGR
eukprot:403372329